MHDWYGDMIDAEQRSMSAAARIPHPSCLPAAVMLLLAGRVCFRAGYSAINGMTQIEQIKQKSPNYDAI